MLRTGLKCGYNTDFGHDYDLLARKIKLFDCFSQYNLRFSVGIGVRSVERLNAHIISGQEGINNYVMTR